MTIRDQLVRLPDGRKLAYNQYGPATGKPIFYCHGAPTARIEFELFGSEELLHALDTRLIAIDRPGMGLSDFQPGRRLLDWPQDVLAVADHLQIERFGVLAYSLGGPPGAACAYALAEHLTRLGIVSGYAPLTDPGIAGSINEETRRFLRMHEQPWLWGPFLWMGAPLARYAPQRLIATASAVLPEPDRALMADPEFQDGFLRMVREALRQGPRGALHESYLAGAEWGFRPQDIRAPVLLWHGEADRNAPVAMGRYLAETIPGCQARFYQGEGHLSLFKKKAEAIIGSLVG